MTDFEKEIAERIRIISQRNGINLTDLAKKAGISHSTFFTWLKKGGFRTAELEELAGVLDVSVLYLMFGKDIFTAFYKDQDRLKRYDDLIENLGKSNMEIASKINVVIEIAREDYNNLIDDFNSFMEFIQSKDKDLAIEYYSILRQKKKR